MFRYDTSHDKNTNHERHRTDTGDDILAVEECRKRDRGQGDGDHVRAEDVFHDLKFIVGVGAIARHQP